MQIFVPPSFSNKSLLLLLLLLLLSFTISFSPLFLVLPLRLSKSPLALAVVNPFRYLNTSISCPRSLLCPRLMRSRYWIRWWYLWFQISGIICVALLCTISILSMSRIKCVNQNCTDVRNVGGVGICIVLCFST